MKVAITFIGEAGSNVWGGIDRLPKVVFEKNLPVQIDTEGVPASERGFYEHLIKKARNNRFFKVEDLDAEDKGKDPKTGDPKAGDPKTGGDPKGDQNTPPPKKAA